MASELKDDLIYALKCIPAFQIGVFFGVPPDAHKEHASLIAEGLIAAGWRPSGFVEGWVENE